jgi:hypothetical protein
MTAPANDVADRRGLSRRIFIALGVAVLVPLVGGMGWALQFTRRDSGLAARLEHLRMALLERRYRHVPLAVAIVRYYDYLQIVPGSVEQFVTEYQEHHERLGPPVSKTDGLHRFLLSTDFFLQGADERKPVRFIALYAPLVNHCYRPFA